MVDEEWDNVPPWIRALAIRTAGLGIVMCVGACASGPPWTLSQSPDEISLRWYPDAAPDGTADSVAQTHCRSWGKNAELVSYNQDGSAQIGHYRCR
jgi:hypothetical protein